MIQFAAKSQIPVLKSIWMECFGDNITYTDYIFSRLIRPNNVLTYSQDGQTVAMLCMCDFTLQEKGNSYKGGYIFGVATLPHHQGKGISSLLLNEAAGYLSVNGYALSCLVPASEHLFGFYSKRGFSTRFFTKKATVLSGELYIHKTQLKLASCSFADFESMRNAFFNNNGDFVRWNTNYLQYVYNECKNYGGDILEFDTLEERGYIFYTKEGNNVLIKEYAGSSETLPKVVYALDKFCGGQRYMLHLRQDVATNWENTLLPFAMVQWYDKRAVDFAQLKQHDHAYIGHVLD